MKDVAQPFARSTCMYHSLSIVTQWSSLSFKERQDKENFLSSEQHVGRGFLKLVSN